MDFYIFNGAGNSFSVADNRSGNKLSTQEIITICKTNSTDGLMTVEKSEAANYKMCYFNSDGTETFCGNGARVLAFFAHQLGLLPKNAGTFEAIDGLHHTQFNGQEWGISLQNIDFFNIQAITNGYFINTGVPHYVEACLELHKLDINAVAPAIRYDAAFKATNGTNVNFYQIIDKTEGQSSKIHIRTYERGVEAETLACGTGATAVALVLAYYFQEKSPIIIHAKGGTLTIYFEKKENRFENIWLFGPVKIGLAS